ncbi:phosphoglycerate mutase [Priestia abyssalis]|uniref:phosphoglycerate mutase n=1 Tax=Priestia abyssalis TaxID=1221450 RepID=UPI000994AD55|nr:phosphoglycerate mutase [Priestia abyssalis]
MDKNVEILSKEAIQMDLSLIKSCLRLINQTITLSKEKGEDFSALENGELHDLVAKIDRNLGKIKVNIEWE